MSVQIDIMRADQQINQTQRRIEEQKARLGRMVVQGTPIQLLEDTLRNIEAILRVLQERRRVIGVVDQEASHLARVSQAKIAGGSQSSYQ